MSAQTEFSTVFKKLKSILEPYSSKLTVKIDTSEGFLSRRRVQRKMEKRTFLWRSADQKELCLFLSHARLHVPRPAQEYFA